MKYTYTKSTKRMLVEIWELCARFGKTRTTIELLKKQKKSRLLILAYYVKTVKTSYKNEIDSEIAYENVKIFDPDSYGEDFEACVNDCISWLKADSSHKAIYLLPLTGTDYDPDVDTEVPDFDSCLERRTKALYKILCDDISIEAYRPFMILEEADFGACCEKQINKINKVAKRTGCSAFIGMTGTNAYKIKKIFGYVDRYVKRDYIVDVLSDDSRESRTNIRWNTFRNSDFITGEYTLANMENWTSFFTERTDGTIEGEQWFKDFFWVVFSSSPVPREVAKRVANIRKKLLLDNKAATMIFTPVGAKNHSNLKRIIEDTLGENNVIVECIDGEHGCTNETSEEIAKTAIRDSNGKKVFFIASSMANRSFSVKEIKNIIFFCNGLEFASVTQKFSRGLTPWKGHCVCNVIDFRFSYSSDDSCRATYLSNVGASAAAADAKANNVDCKGIEETLKAFDRAISDGKVTFNEYIGSDYDPFKTLSFEEVKTMIKSRDYVLQKIENCNCEIESDSVKAPCICGFKEKGDDKKLVSEATKGTSSTAGSRRPPKAYGGSSEAEEDSSVTDKIFHKNFLINHIDFFDTRRFSEDILYKEFCAMTNEDIKMFEETFHMDMETMKDIVEVFHKNGINTDKLFKRY